MTSSEEKASAEISSIIRSSIKKKLIEMGEEIDDELPDYILLMIGWCLYRFTFTPYEISPAEFQNQFHFR